MGGKEGFSTGIHGCVVSLPPSLPPPPLPLCRFHILCSYLLSQESDLSVYDPAINQEHLMKCLQSLIEAYRDLRQQVGGTSPPLPSPPFPLCVCTYIVVVGVAVVTFDSE